MDDIYELIPVTGDDGDGVDDKSTTSTSGGVDDKSTTTGTATGDVDGSTAGDTTDYKAKFLELQSKTEKDVAAVKSSLQKQLEEQRKAFERKELEFHQKLEQIQLEGMDEEDRKQYEAKKRDSDLNRLAREKEDAQRQLNEFQQMQQYTSFATSQLGLKPEVLVLDKGMNPLVESIWSAVTKELGDLRATVKKLSSKSPEPPDVDTNLGNKTPKGKNTMAAAIKKYGSVDAVYAALERGDIKPEEFPLE